MSITIEVKVVPSSGKLKVTLNKANMIVVYLKSQPEKGLANRELIKLIAALLGLVQQQVTLVSGLNSRKKRIRIETDMNKDQLFQALGLTNQLYCV